MAHYGKYTELSSDELGLNGQRCTDQAPLKKQSMQCRLMAGGLSLSLFVNMMILASIYMKHSAGNQGPGSQAVGLRWDAQTTFQAESPFDHANRTMQDAAWSALTPAKFTVALDDQFTEHLGIPHAMRWPWDANKGVYLLQTGHELHCLHALRNTIHELYDGAPPRWPLSHTTHCLSTLLQSVMCNADDSLLYVGYLHDNVKRPKTEVFAGEGSTRKCRSFKQLQAWADQNSACYGTLDPAPGTHIPEIERYKSCPDDRKPWERAVR